MADLQDIGVSAAVNLLTALIFLIAFAIFRLQPINDRVYFPKWYLKGIRASPPHSKGVNKIVNLDFRMYLRFLNWMPEALRMPEPELIEHAGLDSVAYIRIYLLGLKIFVPIAVVAFAVLIPVNWTGKMLEGAHDLTFSNIDKLSISNIPWGSNSTSDSEKLWCFLFVLLRNVPPDPDESVSEHVEHFFYVNHPDHYLLHQTGFCGLWGTRQDAIDYYAKEIEKLSEQEAAERARVLSDPEAILPAAFVSFKSRWGAAVCAQTQQTRNPTIWLTEWAPEPSDVYWDNLAIPYVELKIRRLLMAIALFLLIFFYMAPITFVQSLANINGIEKVFPFLKHLIEKIPKTVGASMPMKATFFITYIMVDGWAGVASEVLRVVPLVMFHLKNTFLVKTEKDREQAMDPGFLDFSVYEPRIQLYFLLGVVYCAVTPILLPFIIVFFAFAYLVFRHQIINVYDRKYESAAAFWPDVHRRIIIGLVISQLLLLGLLNTKGVRMSTPFLIALPVLTIWFYRVCKGRFESAFTRFPLQEAMMKDTLERATDPMLNIRTYLCDAYLHPIFKGGEVYIRPPSDEEEGAPLVATKRSQRSSKVTSLASSEASV
uniref:Uncharacterized protein n=1 Tax=Chenopodium quinoa TaxID=63459 RepID=A0A803MX62_CHEQI